LILFSLRTLARSWGPPPQEVDHRDRWSDSADSKLQRQLERKMKRAMALVGVLPQKVVFSPF